MTPADPPAPIDDDLVLLERWRANDRAAGDRLVTKHFKRIQRFFARKVGDPALAQELVQRTFARCTAKLPGFEGRATFSSFLFGIARNILLERFREVRRDGLTGPLEVEATPAAELDPSPNPFMALEARADRTLIIHALRRLPLDDQILIELYFFEDLSGPQVCEILGVPETTLRARIRACRKRTRELVQGLAESPEQLATTMTTLDSWAQDVRHRVDDPPQGHDPP